MWRKILCKIHVNLKWFLEFCNLLHDLLVSVILQAVNVEYSNWIYSIVSHWMWNFFLVVVVSFLHLHSTSMHATPTHIHTHLQLLRFVNIAHRVLNEKQVTVAMSCRSCWVLIRFAKKIELWNTRLFTYAAHKDFFSFLSFNISLNLVFISFFLLSVDLCLCPTKRQFQTNQIVLSLSLSIYLLLTSFVFNWSQVHWNPVNSLRYTVYCMWCRLQNSLLSSDLFRCDFSPDCCKCSTGSFTPVCLPDWLSECVFPEFAIFQNIDVLCYVCHTLKQPNTRNTHDLSWSHRMGITNLFMHLYTIHKHSIVHRYQFRTNGD